MSVNTLFRFFRPTLFVLAGFIALLLMVPRVGSMEHARREELTPPVSQTLESLVYPEPSIAVKEVVRLQIEGLRDESESDGILQCWNFASPGNRRATGPLDRFARMVRSNSFMPLSKAEHVIIGNPTFVDGRARVLVTVTGRRQVNSYIWILEKQVEAPFLDCWMTEAVFAVTQSRQRRNDVEDMI